jgi:hypothetical protein
MYTTLLKKLPTILALVAVFALGAWARGCVAPPPGTDLKPGTTVVINDSTTGQVTRPTRQPGTLGGLVDATRTAGGRLVAGVQIRTKVDTLYVPVTEVPTETTDSTRTAVVVDTTNTGVQIRIEAEAPPHPAPLKVGYEVVTPEFNPQVGFVRTGRSYMAVVTWGGQQFRVENAFFEPPKRPSTELVTGVRSGVLDGELLDPEVYAGLRQRVAGVTVGVTGSVSRTNDPRLTVSVERALWSR